jgi:hypothetical protein
LIKLDAMIRIFMDGGESEENLFTHKERTTTKRKRRTVM